jgi:uncharacterized membrane protein (UPF0127 family)
MRKIKIFLVILCGVLCLKAEEIKTIPLFIGSTEFVAEIADTREKQIRGLMYRESIPGDYGMLFVYPEESYHSMWMKNCRTSLDIIFLDANKQVINMYIDVPPCKKEPCESYGAERPAKYVLELKGNRARELNLKPGDAIFFILKD